MTIFVSRIFNFIRAARSNLSPGLNLLLIRPTPPAPAVSVHFIRFALLSLSLDLCCLNNCIWLETGAGKPTPGRDNKLPLVRTLTILVGYP